MPGRPSDPTVRRPNRRGLVAPDEPRSKSRDSGGVAWTTAQARAVSRARKRTDQRASS